VPGSSALRTGGLTDAELERAAQIEAELVAREKAAIAENARRRARSGRVDVAITSDPGTPLSVRASHEYAYVARDVRRIAATAALMLSILAALWVLVNVVGIGPA
jgi:fructoselysine-6-P-deglycase FrlB-like protein